MQTAFTAPLKAIDKLRKLLPRVDLKETSFLTNNLSKPDIAAKKLTNGMNRTFSRGKISRMTFNS